ncbi:MAG: arginine--tRNA ligase [Candidatus Pacebacteria bacterium]|nr:arginine--tRNA ligase [Candidatus Paceibacterota bacterium]MDD4998908.1 arginine--tRNA ligase [Candidatus Paceibacterota bacterium]MDD5545449.1 arginine--tRNA ligase [Candidatus Paceibacterota bacterium]
MLKEELKKLISQKWNKISKKNDWPLIKWQDIPLENQAENRYGDYSSPLAFILSKKTKENPLSIAELLKNEMTNISPSLISKIEIAGGGYLNFFVSQEKLAEKLKEAYQKKEKFGFSSEGKNKKIIVDYSSPNIAKPMHIGHLRSTIIGEALSNLYEFLGYKVVRWNYLGDWGTQFGKLIASYKLWGSEKAIKENAINNLLALYVRFHKEEEKNPKLEKIGQEEFKKLEEGDKENKRFWLWFKKASWKEFEKIYQALNIKFDVVLGESFFNQKALSIISFLKNKKIAEPSDGALIVPLDKFGLPPALIQKSDEATLYLTRELAALKYRLGKYQPKKIIYVVGNEQDLHFKQLSALVKILGWGKKTELVHIKFGLVLSNDKKKLSTRKGEIVDLKEVINEAKEKAKKIIKEKHPQWPDKKIQKTGQIIAIGALKFNDLKEFRTADLVFNWEKMLDFSANSSVYLQYTYARINKIIAKAKRIGEYDLKLLNYPLEKLLIKKIIDFPEEIKNSAENYAPNNLAGFLLALADLTNKYYETVPVLKEKNKKRLNSQLVLLKTTASILKTGLKILGIETLREI